MCGIALIVSGIRIDTSSLPFDSTTATPTRKSEKLLFSLDDLKEALRRRGPDSFGAKKVLLQLLGQNGVSSFTVEEDGDAADGAIETAKLHFFGATLQLRGINPLVQPLTDASGNVLVYNGEIFGGLHLASDCNDAEFLLQTLGECCSCGSCATDRCVECGKSSIAGVLSAIKGPWAIIYWQDSSRTLWFGRDAFGRRSLLVHWPTVDDSTFLLSSVSPVSPVQQASAEYEDHNGIGCLSYWEELPCGIYSVHVDASKTSGYLVGEVKIHEYTNSMLNELIKWERISVEPSSEDLHTFCHKLSLGQHAKHQPSSEAVPNKTGSIHPAIPMPAHILLNALKESVLRRTSMYTVYQAVISGIRQEKFFPVAILFSGGLDSMILAALLDKCMDPSYEIDLLNVSFDGQLAPDRKSAKAGLNELRRVAPSRNDNGSGGGANGGGNGADGGGGCVNNDGGRVVNDDGVEGDGRHDGCGGIVCVCLCQCYQWRMAEHGGRLKFCHINTPLHLMAGLPSQIAYGGWQKIRHNIVPWLLFYNTGFNCGETVNFATGDCFPLGAAASKCYANLRMSPIFAYKELLRWVLDMFTTKTNTGELHRWRLVEIDADLSDLVFETSHVMSLINPANTYMDLNIGIALWLAAGGDGWVSDANTYDNDGNHVRIKYKSNAKILLVGSGADEQCAGYGRHRTSYRRGSWLGLHEEMRLDMQRIWRRNLGRDDRCIADNGKEVMLKARFPFLDEDVIRLLLNIPLWEVANLDQPSGIGDKRILREVAELLGLYEAAVLPKRAIQFGSRIARESNRKNFGSNRAANQASAGSVTIHRKSNFC
ncbi:hypothetical protein JHK82_055040 [Glycine max]|nr:hypothetical protein JHK82_055040 [Glycine max]